MSVWTWIKETAFEAATGNVSQSELERIKDEAERQARLTYAGKPPAVVDELVRQARSEVDASLRDMNAHPDQASVLNSTGLDTVSKYAKILTGVVVVFGAVWILAQLTAAKKTFTG